MNDKLTIQELVAYLPWDVKCLIGDSDKIENVELVGKNSVCVGKNSKGVLSWYKISSIRPLLLPISSLTKEIEHKGERFVPLLRICEYLGLKYTKFTVLDNSVDLVLDTKYHRANTKTKEPQKVRFWFNYYKAISFNCSNMKLLMYKDIYGAVQKLAEWHIDFQNLIPQGKAIDKTTIQ